jgi:hypothetical protein
LRVDAAVLVKAFVLRSQNGLLHHFRNIGKANDFASFLAELADQMAVDRENAERNLGAIVRQYFKRRQIRVSERQDDNNHGDRHREQADDEQDGIENPAGEVRQSEFRW